MEDEADPSTVYSMFRVSAWMFRVSAWMSNPTYVDILAHRPTLKMELDTGASVSVISEATFHSTWREEEAPILQPSGVKIHTYTGEEINVVGRIQVVVEHNACNKELPLLVVQGEGPSLMGRDWLKESWTGENTQRRCSLCYVAAARVTVVQLACWICRPCDGQDAANCD